VTIRNLYLFFILAGAAAATACGGDDTFAPEPLTPDPAVVTGCAPDAPPAGQARAKLVACTEELPAGRLVSGRIGDVLLQNSEIEVVLRGFGEGYYLMGTKAGGIVDAARTGGEDLVKEILPIFALNGGAFDEVVITEAGDDGPATVVVRGPIEGVPFISAAIAAGPVEAIAEQHYILEPDAHEVLIRTILFPTGDNEGENVEVGDALFYGGRATSWLPGRGAVTGATNAEFIASYGTTSSYGIVYAPEQLTAIQFADIANVKIGLGPTRTLGNPEPIERWFVVGDGSASSVTDRGWALRGADTGILRGSTAPDVDVVVTEGEERPMTVARSDDEGAYRLSLPAGTYQVWTESPGRAAGTAETAVIAAGDERVLDLEAGGSGTLSVSVTDGSATPLPARVSITAEGFERRIEYTGTNGQLSIPLPPGDAYTVDVSRGMEYDAYTASPVAITDGQTNALEVTLNRVVDTAGWIAIDPHIHSEMSTDSQIPLDERLRAIAGEGVEVAISTDHDFVTDYNDVIDELGLGSWVAAQCGSEVSSLIWGHANAWPLVPDYDKPAGNSIPWYDRSPGEVFALMRARGDDVVVQVNHPRSSDAGLLEIIDFNPVTLAAQRDPEDLGLPASTDLADYDFDALEVANSFSGQNFADGFVDWLALVASGHPAAITGSSDSHGKSAYVGGSRTYVYVGPGYDDPATVDLDALNLALKARKAVVGQGAFVTAAIVDPSTSTAAAPGELTDLSGESQATLAIRVQAPPWMPLARIIVYGGKVVATTINLDSGDTAAVRYDNTVTLPLEDTDGFFVVLVEPAGAGSPVLGTPDGSVTNPLLYDRDGDGLWTP